LPPLKRKAIKNSKRIPPITKLYFFPFAIVAG